MSKHLGYVHAPQGEADPVVYYERFGAFQDHPDLLGRQDLLDLPGNFVQQGLLFRCILLCNQCLYRVSQVSLCNRSPNNHKGDYTGPGHLEEVI